MRKNKLENLMTMTIDTFYGKTAKGNDDADAVDDDKEEEEEEEMKMTVRISFSGWCAIVIVMLIIGRNINADDDPILMVDC